MPFRSLFPHVKSAAAIQNVTEEIFGDRSLIHDLPVSDKVKSFGWQCTVPTKSVFGHANNATFTFT